MKRIPEKEVMKSKETYKEMLKRLINNTKKNQLRDLFMDETNTITIKEAKRRLNNGKSNNN